MTDVEMIAAFLAKKGATRVEAGARAYSERSMYLAVRGEPVETEDQASERRAERMAEQAMEARYNGHRVVGWDSRGNIETA
jgi:hypothetical protein